MALNTSLAWQKFQQEFDNLLLGYKRRPHRLYKKINKIDMLKNMVKLVLIYS